MSAPQQELEKVVQRLAEINRLSLRAFKAKSAQALTFLILNDTVPIVKYDRALLWRMDKRTPQLLGISGQAAVSKHTDLSKHWKAIVENIKDPEKAQELVSPDLPAGTSVLWLPLFVYEKPALGLWLERWNSVPWRPEEAEILQFLMQNYGAAWERFMPRYRLFFSAKKPLLVAGAISLLLLSFLRVPLRIVAPCEVVPDDPIVVTAPLEGIIEEIRVTPGQEVKKGQLLFEYDKRVPLQDLRVSQKKVEIIRSEVDRTTAQSYKDKKALAELAVQALRLKKEQLELELAEYRASLLNVASPDEGVAMVDAPEEWRGKPVKIGEKVMVVADPLKTKVRMWIPEDDYIELNLENPISIFLNPSPEKSRKAKISYISNYTHVSEKGIPSFIGEANWMEGQNLSDVKLGLKGSAILYGEDVSLFYWVVRKPWAYLRRFVGI